MKWLELIKNLAPIILALVPGVPPAIIPAIMHGITTAEGMPGATGAQKKAAVLDLVQVGMETANAVAGKTIVDPAGLSGVVGLGIDTAVNAVNIIHAAQPVPPAPAA